MSRWIPVLLALACAGRTFAQNEAPLAIRDLTALLDVGCPGETIARTADRRGVAFSVDPALKTSLARRGFDLNTIAAIDRAAAKHAAGRDDHALVIDLDADVTFRLPPQWIIEKNDGRGRLRRIGLPYGAAAEIDVKRLDPAAAELNARGISTLNALHALRIEEIRRAEGANWTFVGSWPLVASGWVGVHGVFEDRPSDTERSTRCLTWFDDGDGVLSLFSRIVTRGRATLHDEIADEVTAILRDNAPGWRTAADLAAAAAARRRFGAVVLDAQGAARRILREALEDDVAPVIPAGHAKIAASPDGSLLLAEKRDGGFTVFDRGTLRTLPPLPGTRRSLAVDPLAEFAWIVDATAPDRARRMNLTTGKLENGGAPELRDVSTAAASAAASAAAESSRAPTSIDPPIGLTLIEAAIADGRTHEILVARVDDDFQEWRWCARSATGSREILWRARFPAAKTEGVKLFPLATAAGACLFIPEIGLLALPRKGGLAVLLHDGADLADVATIR